MKDRKWVMLFVILAFAIIVGLAKRLRKLLIQEEGFTSNKKESSKIGKIKDYYYYETYKPVHVLYNVC